MQTVGTRHYCSPLWYASDRNGLLIKVGGVGGDFSQTDMQPLVESLVVTLPSKLHWILVAGGCTAGGCLHLSYRLVLLLC